MNEYDVEQTKKEINNFLWSNLPYTTTLVDAESYALDILSLFTAAWKKHENRKALKCVSRDK